MNFLITDVETTNLYKTSYTHDHPDQGRMIQFAAGLYNQDFQELAFFHSLVAIPQEVNMSDHAFATHHISLDFARKYGMPVEIVMANFAMLAGAADIIVGHNIKFEKDIFNNEWKFFNGEMPPVKLDSAVCTMWMMTPICKLTQANGRAKWPKLEEAYKHCVGHPPDKAHDAAVDVRTTLHVFKWCVDNKVYSFEKAQEDLTSKVLVNSASSLLNSHL